MHQTNRWSIAEDWHNSGTPGWFVDPKHVPGGAFIDEGIYGIDFLSWMAKSDIVEVEARMANLVHKELKVEDWGMATLTFANGIIATLEGSWTINSPQKTKPSPKHNAVVRTELIGTRGEIVDQIFREPGRAVLAAGASDWVFERKGQSNFGPRSPFPLNHLVDCLNAGAPDRVQHPGRTKGFHGGDGGISVGEGEEAGTYLKSSKGSRGASSLKSQAGSGAVSLEPCRCPMGR